MGGHSQKIEEKKDNFDLDVTPKEYELIKTQKRARPQWDPRELGNKLLDRMEAEGRLHRRKK